MSINEVLAAALNLGEQDRALLAHKLLLSLRPPGEEVVDASEWEAAAMEVVQRRDARYQRGETTARDWREAIQDVRRRSRARSAAE
jgi:hypothetical protein